MKTILATEFEIKDLESLRYFSGMEVARSKNGIVICKMKYILDLLKEIGNLVCKPAATFMDLILFQNQSEEYIISKHMYQRLVEKLIYLSHTRPYIAYSVSIVSLYMNSPNEYYLRVVNRILRYLKGTLGDGLLLKNSSNRMVELHTNASLAGELIDQSYTSEYCSYVWGNFWRSKKQIIVASNVEAEY